MAPKKSKKNKSAPKPPEVIEPPQEKGDLMDRLHYPYARPCTVPPTSPDPKPDAFDMLRPEPGIYIDYKISQTDTKLDAGPTKIHLQETKAEYIRPPPGYVFPEPPKPPKRHKPKKKGKEKGIGPCWVFLDEIWRDKQEALQKMYRKEARERRAKNKTYLKLSKDKAHRHVLDLVGPEWFQELSPNQMRTVEDLRHCILKDIRYQTIINTQENIASLGLVLRPNKRHVEIALNNCCQNPVEFLLVLYQLTNPNRIEYSLNDRLLLSAVVHLTMTETLKELHIRIPSPPPPVIKPKPVPQKPKRVPAISPYLEQFVFKPEPRKHTGTYENRQIQYPESPYFSYLPHLKEEIRLLSLFYRKDSEDIKKDSGNETESNSTSEDGSSLDSNRSKQLQLRQELKAAQIQYNILAGDGPAPKLLMPALYKRYGQNYGENQIETKSEERPTTGAHEEEKLEKLEKGSESETNISVSVEVRITTDFDGHSQPINKRCECIITFDKNNASKRSVCPSESATCFSELNADTNDDSSTSSESVCHCQKRKESKNDKKNIISNICPCGGRIEKPLFIVSNMKKTKSGNMIPIIAGIVRKERKKKPIFIISNVKKTRSGQVIPIVEGIKRTDSKNNVSVSDDIKEQYLKMCAQISSTKEGKVSRRRLPNSKPIFIISNVKKTMSGQVIPIISGMARVTNTQKKPIFIISNVVITKSGEVIPIIGGIARVTCEISTSGNVCCKTRDNTTGRKELSKYTCKEVCRSIKGDKKGGKEPLLIISGIKETESGNVISVIAGVAARSGKSNETDVDRYNTHDENATEGKDLVKYKRNAETERTTKPSVCCHCGKRKQVKSHRRKKHTFIISSMKETESGEIIPIIQGVVQSIEPSAPENAPRKQKGPKPQDSNNVETKDLMKTTESSEYPCGAGHKINKPVIIISNMKKSWSGNMIPIITGIHQKITEKKVDTAVCKCKAEVQRIIDSSVCPCDRCKEDRRHAKRKPTFIISNVNITESGEPLPVIEGVKAEQKCHCLERYHARIKKYEELNTRREACAELERLQKKFVIGGVSQGSDGRPIYIISGLQEQREYKCDQFTCTNFQEKRRLENMPKIPLGRLKYVISGVQETPAGNVYIVSGVVPVEDCDCTKLYNEFTAKHSVCMNAYTEYLQKLKDDVDEYMRDAAVIYGPKEEDCGDTLAEQNTYEEEQSTHEEAQYINEEIYSGNETTSETEALEELYQCVKCDCNKKKSTDSNSEASDGAFSDLAYDTDTNLSIRLEINKDKEVETKKKRVSICCPEQQHASFKICQDIDLNACECMEERQEEQKQQEERELPEKEEQQVELRRIIILDKIPCNPKKQMKILKAALASLAEDGFPLAKLPDAHKLPHFKLWLQMRCGIYFTQKDRQKMMEISKMLWRHTDYCTRKVPIADLNMSPRQAASYTWRQAKFVREAVAVALDKYFRSVKQASIEDGREYFPTTFSYELPTPTFRDCYFAYTGTKEEDVLAQRVWQSFEIKNFRGRKTCLASLPTVKPRGCKES